MVLFVSIATYAPSIGFSLLDWDDQLHLSANPFIQVDSPNRYGHFWKEPYSKMYVPLAYNAWALLYPPAWSDTGQLQPGVFHGANVAVHAVNSLLVFTLLLRMRFAPLAGAIGAVLFSVHPMQAESVCWVSELRGLLAGMFALAAMILHLGRWNRPIQGRLWIDAATILLIVAGMLSKPSAAVASLVIGIIDLGVLRRHWREVAVAILLPLLATAGLLIFQSTLQPAVTSQTVEVWKRPLIAADAIGFYLRNLFWPFGLCTDYARTPEWVSSTLWLWTGWIIPAALLGIILLTRYRRTGLAAVAVFVAALAPVLGLVWFEFQLISTVADRYAYLAVLGPAMLAAHWLSQKPRKTSRIIAGIILLGLALRTIDQSQHWRNDQSLWTHTATVNLRSAVAQSNLGMLAADMGKIDAARGHYLAALAIQPKRVNPYLGLATLDRDAGDYAQAEARYREAMKIDPANSAVPTDLASLLAQTGRLGEAEAPARLAVTIDPNDADAWNNLGAILYEKRRFSEAQSALGRAIAIHPRHPTAYNALARVREAMGDPSSIELMTKAARFNRADSSPCLWLGKRAMTSQNWDQAQRWFTEALRREPRNIEAMNDLGQVLAASGQVDDAIACFEQALQVSPDHPVLRENLASARKLKERISSPAAR